MDNITLGLAWYVVFVLSASMHEAAHAFTALKFGDTTAYHGGQVTLHPLPHMRREPFGMILVPIVSFLLNGWMIGWASAPIDSRWANENQKKAAFTSLAGPASNLSLVLISGILMIAGTKTGVFEPSLAHLTYSRVISADPGSIANGAATMLSICFSLNLLLAVFNMMPFPPFDGASLVTLLADRRTAGKYLSFSRQQGMPIFGLIIAWTVIGFIFPRIYLFAVGLLFPAA